MEQNSLKHLQCLDNVTFTNLANRFKKELLSYDENQKCVIIQNKYTFGVTSQLTDAYFSNFY